MPEVLLFGATGYTGRLTAHALARRGADFAISGRDRTKLERLGAETGDPEIRVAAAGDVDALTDALSDVKVLITCVGPFVELGATAVEAALRAGVHYIDSTGEGAFIADLIATKSGTAAEAGIAMAPAMGFDEVPADFAATRATEGFDESDLTLTYALPTAGSRGTIRSALGIAGSKGQWIRGGMPVSIRVGEHQRWAPLPPPLGPRSSISFPLAEGHLAPLHLNLNSLEIYLSAGNAQRVALRTFGPVLGVFGSAPVKAVVNRLVEFLPEGPNEEQRRRGRWTILAEARSGADWRNVVVTGTDVYGLTAEFLSAGALKIAREGPEQTGVVSPVQAMGIEMLEKLFPEVGINVEVFEERPAD
jgi:short subunit dehydrogenase-like uncharacterized protein